MSAEVIDHETGEVVSAELVPTDNMAALDALDPQSREVAVTRMLSEARSWLAHAVEATEPQTIANFKAQMATIAEATKQLGLSKEIQLDAQEMVRRAERGVGVAIRKGQEVGTVATRERAISDAALVREAKRRGDQIEGITSDLPKASSYATTEELTGNGAGILHMTDGVTDEDFDSAISEAKDEGNLSRANVVRKIKGQQSPATRDDRAREVARLAGLGYSSRQIAPKIGVGPQALAPIARDYGITITADRHTAGTHNTDTNRIIEKAVSALEGIALGLDFIDPGAIDPERAQAWADSLTHSIAAIRKARHQIKESVNAQS